MRNKNRGASTNNTIILGNGNGDVVNDFDFQTLQNVALNNSITVGNGSDTIYVGNSDTITVGHGQDSFVFEQTTPGTIGAVTVTGFNPANDVLNFNPALIANYAAAMVDTKQVGLDTVITVDATDTVTLTGVAASHLTASNFHFT